MGLFIGTCISSSSLWLLQWWNFGWSTTLGRIDSGSGLLSFSFARIVSRGFLSVRGRDLNLGIIIILKVDVNWGFIALLSHIAKATRSAWTSGLLRLWARWALVCVRPFVSWNGHLYSCLFRTFLERPWRRREEVIELGISVSNRIRVFHIREISAVWFGRARVQLLFVQYLVSRRLLWGWLRCSLRSHIQRSHCIIGDRNKVPGGRIVE